MPSRATSRPEGDCATGPSTRADPRGVTKATAPTRKQPPSTRDATGRTRAAAVVVVGAVAAAAAPVSAGCVVWTVGVGRVVGGAVAVGTVAVGTAADVETVGTAVVGAGVVV